MTEFKNRKRLREASKQAFDKRGKRLIDSQFKDESYLKRWWAVMLAVLLLMFMENIISAVTSYSFFYGIGSAFATSMYAAAFSILFLTLFEALAISTYFKNYKEWFHKDLGFDTRLFAGIIILTAFKMFFSWTGAEPLLFNWTKPPAAVQADSMEYWIKTQIAAKNQTIKNIQNQDRELLKRGYWVDPTNKQVAKLESAIQSLEAKLLNKSEIRDKQNEVIMMQHESTIYFNRDKVRWIAIIANLLSLFVLAPTLGYMVVKAKYDYDQQFIEPEPEPDPQPKRKRQPVALSENPTEADLQRLIKLTKNEMSPYKSRLKYGIGKATTQQKNLDRLQGQLDEYEKQLQELTNGIKTNE